MDQAVPLLKRLRCYPTDIKSMRLFFLYWKNLELHIRIQFLWQISVVFLLTYLLLALLIRKFCIVHGVWITFNLCLHLYFMSHVLLLLLYHTFSLGPSEIGPSVENVLKSMLIVTIMVIISSPIFLLNSQEVMNYVKASTIV